MLSFRPPPTHTSSPEATLFVMWLRCAINKFTLEEEEEAIKLFLPPPPLPNVRNEITRNPLRGSLLYSEVKGDTLLHLQHYSFASLYSRPRCLQRRRAAL